MEQIMPAVIPNFDSRPGSIYPRLMLAPIRLIPERIKPRLKAQASRETSTSPSSAMK
jgi:hypothetical protein